MGMLDYYQAQHFISGYNAVNGATRGSFRQWSNGLILHHNFKEGSPAFNIYRETSLREVERLLFLASSNYRRSFDLQIASSSSWAYVTLYYGAFYSAQAILGAFGVWKLRNYVIDVNDGTPGSQEFQIKSMAFTYKGTHERFWEFFYNTVQSISPWIDPSLRYAITPVSSNPVWQIQNRNELNYDTFESYKLISNFKHQFRQSKFNITLPTVLNTQFKIMEGLLIVAAKFAKDLGIATQVTDLVFADGDRKNKYKKLILEPKTPNVNRFIKKSAFK